MLSKWWIVLGVSNAFVSAWAAPGDWKLDYPPWGESGLPTSNSPVIWFPFIGPFTRHGCFPSRYMSGRIAVSHINRRDSTFCPAIATLKNKFEFRYDLADSNGNGVGAARAVLKFLSNGNGPSSSRGGRKVSVVLGPNGSGSSISMSNILAVFLVAHISWAATSASLSNKAVYPMFFRVVSPDSLTMRTLAGWLHKLGNISTVNVIYFDASYQSGQASDFISPAKSTFGMTVNEFKIPNSGDSGAKVSPENMVHMKASLKAVRDSGYRVVVALMISEEAYDLVKEAHDMGMVQGHGWMWCGTDGINGGQFAGISSRVKYFKGFLYIQSLGQGAGFAGYADKWAQLMPSTKRPEFDSFNLCINTADGNKEQICKGNPEFKGWTDGQHDAQLLCKGYTGLAYDAAVTLAIVADKMITKGKNPSALTEADWLEEMKLLSEPGVTFDCLTATVTFNKNQERDMEMGVFNWQDQLSPTMVMKWNGQLGYKWVVGAKVVWPSGETGTVTKPDSFPTPSGMPPVCTAGPVLAGDACGLCETHTYFDQKLRECRSCPAGRMQVKKGQTECTRCPKGFFSNASVPECAPCGRGTVADSEGMEACSWCRKGMYMDQLGKSECNRCPVGTYTSTTGTTECVSCQNEIKDSSTLFQGAADKGDCKCMKGSYDGEVLHNSKSCVGCDEGLQCDEAGLRKPYQAKGYYIDGANTKAVYLCSPPEACEGGDWAASVCRAPRTGFLCMTCPKGLTLNSDLDDASAKGCKECVWIASVILALAPIVVFCCLLAVIYHTHHNALDDDVVFTEAQNTIGQLIMFVQVTNACFSTRVKYGEPVLSFVDEVFAQLDPDKVLSNAPCLSEFMKEPVTQYAITITSPMIMIGCLFAAYFISLLGCNGKLMFDGVFNVVGEVLVEFYISVTLAIFAPFDCYDHPNGAKSVQKFPKIICGEGDHGAMMGLAVIGILAYPVNAICVSLYHTWQLPRSMAANANELRILIRCHFLFGRWKPETCWFCNVTIIRNFFFAVFPMIMPQDQLDVTIVLMIVTLMTALVLTVWFKPRRNIMQNVLDTFISAVQLIITTFGLSSVHGQSVSESLSGFLLILMALVITAVMSLMVLKAFQLLHPAGKAQVQYAVYLCHHAGAGGAAARVLHSMLLKAIKGRIFYDIDNLSNDTKLIDSIKVSNNLVVVFGSETLCRTWCIGAIVAAYRKSIPMQTVVFTDPLPEETVCGDAPNSSYVKKSFGASSTKASKKSMVEVDTTPLRGHGVDQRFAHPAIDALMQLDPTLLNLLSEREMNTNFQTILDAMPRCERGTPVDVVVSSVFRPATTPKEPNLPGGMLILIDQMDGEAVAVCRLMRAVFSLTGTCLQDQDIPPNEYAKVAKGQNVETAIFLLTARTLTCGVQLSRFALLWKNKPSVHVVPVVVGLTFDFPDQDYLSNLQLGRVLALGSSPAERLASFAGDMVSLKMIADSLTHVMTFLVIFINVANLTQVKLDKAMADVLDRVHNKTGRRASFHGEKAEALVAPEPVASQEAAIDIDV